MKKINVFTVDVEDYYQVEAFSKVIDRKEWGTYESRVADNTDKILALLEEKNIKATFFILGCVAEKNPSIVRAIAQNGHEIASHGMTHMLVYNQTREVFKEETHKSKTILEDICQQSVIGYRAATYSITKKSLWALDVLIEEGFKYDSSIFPMRHDKYGISDIERSPHVIQRNNGSIVEFPISVYENGAIKIPCAGGGYFRLLPYWMSKWCLNQINKSEEFIFYIHPWEVDVNQPVINDATLFSKFRHYNNLSKCESRLKNLFNDFYFTTVQKVLNDKKLI